MQDGSDLRQAEAHIPADMVLPAELTALETSTFPECFTYSLPVTDCVAVKHVRKIK